MGWTRAYEAVRENQGKIFDAWLTWIGDSGYSAFYMVRVDVCKSDSSSVHGVSCLWGNCEQVWKISYAVHLCKIMVTEVEVKSLEQAT